MHTSRRPGTVVCGRSSEGMLYLLHLLATICTVALALIPKLSVMFTM